ncbi:MAG TPA: hypothetical protein VIT21_09835 [Chthoniobacterales bacterium]
MKVEDKFISIREENPVSCAAPRFGFRECLLLCLPALIAGVFFRTWQMILLPQALLDGDSGSFFKTSFLFWDHFEFYLESKRRWLYPIFLWLLPPVPLFSPANLVAFLQHAAGMVSVVAAGWIAGNVLRFRRVFVPLFTLVYALWPEIVAMEHSAMAESFATAGVIIATALMFPLATLRRRLFPLLVMLFVVLAMKTIMRPYWGLLMLVTLFFAPPWTWQWRHWIPAVGCLVILAIPGNKTQPNWLLLSSTLPFVKTEGKRWQPYRTELAPWIKSARATGSQYPWTQDHFKTPIKTRGEIGPNWDTLLGDKPKFATVAKSLAFEAIVTHPTDFVRLVIAKTGKALAEDTYAQLILPQQFIEPQSDRVNATRWIQEEPMMRMFFRMTAVEWAANNERLARQTSLPGVALFRVYHVLTPSQMRVDPVTGENRIVVTWLGWMGILGAAAMLVRRQWWPAIATAGIPAVFLLAIYCVGDSLGRHALPAGWACFFLPAVFLDSIWTGAAALLGFCWQRSWNA